MCLDLPLLDFRVILKEGFHCMVSVLVFFSITRSDIIVCSCTTLVKLCPLCSGQMHGGQTAFTTKLLPTGNVGCIHFAY